MKLRFGKMPSWLQRLLLLWGAGIAVVVILFLLITALHLVFLGAILGVIFFTIQAIYRCFKKQPKIPSHQKTNTTKENRIFEHEDKS